MDNNETTMEREELLILDDDDFNPSNVCIVTGAGGGIGRALAITAAANNLITVGLDVDQKGGKKTEEIAGKMGGKMVFIRTDLTRDAEIENAVREASKFGSIKYLANIAGLQHIASIEDFPMEKYDLMMRIMLRAPFYLSKLVMPHMRENREGGGVIGNMASIHAHICTINKPVYNIAKFGLRALSQSISAEGGGKIRSFTVSTGFVKTDLALNQIPLLAEQHGISSKEVVETVMMGKSRIKEMMTPIEVANLFIFGFSRHSRHLIGGDLLFDGGVVLTY
ncbi:MAG: SDR family oxidoreductase [Nitrospirae bacterium]|nr:SDR family oxidoreductase [Nitrospirota bacterium]